MIQYLIFFIFGFSSLCGSERSILCIDIGSTRIKATVLSTPLTIKNLKKVRPILVSSENWISEKLPFLLSTGGIFPLIDTPYDAISLSLPSPIQDNAILLGPQFNKAPREIKKAFEAQAGCTVYVENDAVCHLRGALLWQTLTNTPTTYPCAFIALGTWVGCALAKSPEEVEDIEISDFKNIKYLKLKAVAAAPTYIEQYYLPHYALGNGFFKNTQLPLESHKKTEYQKRVEAFIADFCRHFNVKTLFIGGGNSRLIPLKLNVANIEVHILNSQFFHTYELQPELIPLLGCFATAQALNLETAVQ